VAGWLTNLFRKWNTANVSGGISTPFLSSTLTAADQTGRVWSERRTHQELMSFYGHWVSICARKNASVCSSQKLRLYDKTGTRKGRKMKAREVRRIKEMGGDAGSMARFGAVEIETHQILDLLNNPSPYYTAADTSYLRFVSKEIVGDAYALIDDQGPKLEMIPLLPQYVSVKLKQMGDAQCVEGYLYGRDLTIAKLFPVEAMFHTKFAPDPTDPYSGRGPVSDIFPYAQLLTLATLSEQARWKNFGLPPVQVDLDANTNPDKVSQLMESIKRQVQGVLNSGNWLVTQGAKVNVLPIKPRDMEYTAGSMECAKTIWAAFDIPESVVRPNEGSLAAAAAGDPAWMRYGILPRLQRDADDLTNKLLPMFDGDTEGMFFAYDNPVAEDEAAKVTMMIQLKTAGIIGVNEAREELGRDPMEEVEEPAEVEDAATETEQEDDAEDDTEEAPVSKHVGFYDSSCGCCAGRLRVKEVDKLTALENALKVAVDNWLKRVSELAAVGMEQVPPILQAELMSILERYFTEGYQDAASGSTMSPQTVLEHARTYAGQRTRLIIEELTNTTNDKLAEVVARAAETGDKRTAVQEIMGQGMNEDRAAVIARTEVANIQGAVSVAQIEEAGQSKQWDTLASACPICLALVDKIVAKYGTNAVPPGVPFMKAGESLTYVDEAGSVRTFTAKWDINSNPAHPNCACIVIGVPTNDN